ncbi:MAG: hypothetical protein OEQ53_23075, partial [Saprospiraceae bacterium]|nr:hypothetical protein [Saprospiraceae bacterium]
MKDILAEIQKWEEQNQRFAMATVVDTWRAAPRMIGSTMLISEDLDIVGSVSGGCVEGSVIKQAKETLASGEAKLLMFGVSNEDAWSVGLSCGGKIKVFVEPFVGQKPDENSKIIWQRAKDNLMRDEPFVLISQINGNANK